MTTKTNTARKTVANKAAALVTAKVKAPTKAERLRTNFAKANASAAKRLDDGLTFDVMATDLVTATRKADGAARTMAHWMNNEFADVMAANKCHWSAFTAANCRTDNEKAILARIDDYRKAVQELALAKGLANINKPWSDMRRVALDLFSGGKPREGNAKPLDTVQRDILTKLYRKGMKEERATEAEMNLNYRLGELLVEYFRVDLAKLG